MHAHVRVCPPVDARVFQAEDHLEKTLGREEELKGSGCWRSVELIILESPTSTERLEHTSEECIQGDRQCWGGGRCCLGDF